MEITQPEKPTFTSVSIPKELTDKIDSEIVGKHGYRSRGDFVTDAVRRRLEALEKGAE